MPRIEADLLLPGRGDPIRNGCVVFDGPTIAYAGPIEDAPKASARMETHRVPVVMPGLWEAHGHFFGIRTANLEESMRTPVQVLVSRTVKDVERALLAGITSVREVGGFGVYLSRVVNEGTLNGPHIYAAGSPLSQTGGHGDIHAFPLEWVVEHQQIGGFGQLCDGVPECLKAVRSQLRLGARVIKVLASGGIASELDHPVHPQFTEEELRAIVAEAARAERAVAAHCHGGIAEALRAGCHTIEHGTYLTEETAAMIIERRAVLVPTRFVFERALKLAKQLAMPSFMVDKFTATLGRHTQALRLAIRKGVPIAMGTDIITSGVPGMAWGENAAELLYFVEAGMKPLQAIEAATANGPLTLGPQAPRSGQLLEGYDADVLAVTQDPLRDLAVLTSPDNVLKVWKAGALVKDLTV